jgi:hypothetical protein
MSCIRWAQSSMRLDKVRNENTVAWFTLEPKSNKEMTDSECTSIGCLKDEVVRSWCICKPK